MSIYMNADGTKGSVTDSSYKNMIQINDFHFGEFYFVSSGHPNFTYEKIKLSNAIFSHFSLEHDSDSQAPIEFMSLDYTDIERTYIPRDKENNIGNPRTSGYSLTKATSL